MMFKKVILMMVLVGLSSVLTACNTVAGAGEDIQAGGKTIEKAANDAK